MAYFSNATDLMNYEHQYCRHCVHIGGPDGDGCAVMLAHQLRLDDEWDKKDSILHMLIPRSGEQRDDNRFNGGNDKCLMFYAREVAG